MIPTFLKGMEKSQAGFMRTSHWHEIPTSPQLDLSLTHHSPCTFLKSAICLKAEGNLCLSPHPQRIRQRLLMATEHARDRHSHSQPWSLFLFGFYVSGLSLLSVCDCCVCALLFPAFTDEIETRRRDASCKIQLSLVKMHWLAVNWPFGSGKMKKGDPLPCIYSLPEPQAKLSVH